MKTYSTYQQARTALLQALGISGPARVQAGVITMMAKFNGEFIRVAQHAHVMYSRSAAYTEEGREFHFTINPLAFPKNRK